VNKPFETYDLIIIDTPPSGYLTVNARLRLMK